MENFHREFFLYYNAILFEKKNSFFHDSIKIYREMLFYSFSNYEWKIGND